LGAAPPPSEAEQVARDHGLIAAMDQVFQTRGRTGFETKTGFTVVGATIGRAIAHQTPCDVFQEGPAAGPNHVRVHADAGRAGSVLIQFDDGRGVCLAILPEYVGTVLVEDQRVVNVNYTPAAYTWRRSEYDAVQDEIERRRAFVATAARYGSFRIEPDQASRYGRFLRWGKSLDPTLGIYAAYAYAQAGLQDEVESVHRYMEQDGPVPFDVALLAHRLTHTAVFVRPPAVRPVLPMLTQGWSLARAHNAPMPPMAKDLARHLLPALWTTLARDGVGLLWRAIEKGDVA
jgi:hypothetical protein